VDNVVDNRPERCAARAYAKPIPAAFSANFPAAKNPGKAPEIKRI